MKYLLLIFFILTIISCNTKHDRTRASDFSTYDTIDNELPFYTEESNSDLTTLNNNAVKILQTIHQVSDDKTKDSLLNDALRDVNTAIQKDSDFYYAYLNKAAILRVQGKFEESADALQELLERNIYPEAIFALGLTYEKLGNLQLANEKYREALAAYDKHLKTPHAIVQDEINRLFVLVFVEGKENVLKQIEDQLEKEPENTELATNKRIIEEFNREEFISNFQ